MMLKTRFMAGVAGCALAAGSVALAATQQFESGTVGDKFVDSAWSGDGVTQQGSVAAPSNGAGYPISIAELGNANKFLEVEGSAVFANGATGSGLVDMMIKVSYPDPDDGLETPDGAPQIAVAVDSNGRFNVYCKDRNGNAGWHQLSDTVVAEDTWKRVSLLFDYDCTPAKCQVRIDGEPMMTSVGYGKADGSGGNTGAWYTLANNPTESAKITNFQVSGCTAIDEVKVDQTATASSNYLIAGGTGDTLKPGGTVPAKWFDDNGIAWDVNAQVANSEGVLGSYLRCLDPHGTETFDLKGMAKSGNKVKLTLPATVATTGRKVELVTYSNSGFTTEVGDAKVVTGQTEVEVDVPTSGVYYYKLRAKDQ